MSEASSQQQLPTLDSSLEVSDDLTTEFQRNGHAFVRGVCSTEEVSVYGDVIREAALRESRETRPLEKRDTYSKAFLQIENLWRCDERVKRFVFAPRFADLAARLLGVEAVRLYHDQALLKEPGGGRTPWHQDQYYWPLDTSKTITMWMPLVDVPAEVGSMTFVSGSHERGDMGHLAISDESDDTFAAMIDAEGLRRHTYGELRAGDATFHAGWTLHSAPPNPTSLLRSVMTIIWFADGARITEPTNSFQEADRNNWLGGLAPGSLASSDTNPVLSS